MATKDIDFWIKIQILITINSRTPEDAYNFFDEDGDGK